MAEPRLGRKRPKTLKKPFVDADAAMALLRGSRGDREIATLVAAAQSGYETALLIGVFFPLYGWITSPHGPKGKRLTEPRRADKKDWPASSKTTLIESGSTSVPATLSALTPFAQAISTALAACIQLFPAAFVVDAFLKANPQIDKDLVHWKSPPQLAIGMAVLTAEHAEMKRVTPREMAAVLLIVGAGDLQRETDDDEATEDAVVAMKRMMSRASKQVLPGLRAMTGVLAAKK